MDAILGEFGVDPSQRPTEEVKQPKQAKRQEEQKKEAQEKAGTNKKQLIMNVRAEAEERKAKANKSSKKTKNYAH